MPAPPSPDGLAVAELVLVPVPLADEADEADVVLAGGWTVVKALASLLTAKCPLFTPGFLPRGYSCSKNQQLSAGMNTSLMGIATETRASAIEPITAPENPHSFRKLRRAPFRNAKHHCPIEHDLQFATSQRLLLSAL